MDQRLRYIMNINCLILRTTLSFMYWEVFSFVSETFLYNHHRL